MPRLEYSTASAAHWRSWVVPLQALCAGTGQQPERLKLELAVWVNEGRLEAWGTSKEHLVLHYAVLKQSSDVSRSLVSACETQDIRVHSLDPFDVELFGWTPPEEMYKKAKETFASAAVGDDLKGLVEALLQKGFKPDVADKMGRTAASLAKSEALLALLKQ